MNELSAFFTERALMEYLNLSKAQIEAMRAHGLPCIKVNRRLRFYRESRVAAWLDQFDETPDRDPSTVGDSSLNNYIRH